MFKSRYLYKIKLEIHGWSALLNSIYKKVRKMQHSDDNDTLKTPIKSKAPAVDMSVQIMDVVATSNLIGDLQRNRYPCRQWAQSH